MDTYERKQSRMTTADIQRDLDMIRLAYRNRECEPLNYYRSQRVVGWVVVGMAIGCIAAAFLIF